MYLSREGWGGKGLAQRHRWGCGLRLQNVPSYIGRSRAGRWGTVTGEAGLDYHRRLLLGRLVRDRDHLLGLDLACSTAACLAAFLATTLAAILVATGVASAADVLLLFMSIGTGNVPNLLCRAKIL